MDPRQTRLLTIGLGFAIVLATAGVVYFALTPQSASTQYTEFYMLGPDGEANGYPTNLTVGEPGKIIVGIKNREGQRTTYTVALRLGERVVNSTRTTVEPGESWQDEFIFTAESTGRMRLRVLLFKGENSGDTDDPYRSLRLWITVSEPVTTSEVPASSVSGVTAGDRGTDAIRTRHNTG